MTPDQILVWLEFAQKAVTIGVNIVSTLRSLLAIAHPSLTPAQLDAAYVAILTDDSLRATWAERASHPSPPA